MFIFQLNVIYNRMCMQGGGIVIFLDGLVGSGQYKIRKHCSKCMITIKGLYRYQ